MRQFALLILILFTSTSVFGQVFFPTQNPITEDSPAGPESIFLTDLDGDSDNDLLVLCGGSQTLVWYENIDGTNEFSKQNLIVDGLSQPQAVIAFDADGDGDQDVLLSSWGDDALFLFKNTDGQGDFSEQSMVDNYASGIWSARPADIDGDGDLDIFAALREGSAIVWYENVDGNGSFSEKKYIKDDMQNAREAYPVDMDNDGDVDVVTADWFTNIIGWHENLDGNGNFSERMEIYNDADDVNQLFCVDMNNDGKTDILTYKNDELFWLENLNNDGSFGDKNVISDEIISDFFPSDVDGDGNIDLIAGIGYRGKLVWFQNDGTGTFGPENPLPQSFDNVDRIAGADLDGDGDNDVVGVALAKSISFWFKNLDGGGNFSDGVIIDKPQLTSPIGMLITDTDGDQDNDIIIASLFDENVYLFEKQYRSSSYAAPKIIAENIITITSVKEADMDGDGRKDLLVCNDDGEVYWSKNMGNNSYLPKEMLVEWDFGLYDIAAADLDMDGDMDLLLANRWGDKLSFYENNGGLIFGSPIDLSTDLGGVSLVSTFDMDMDGDQDILAASLYDDKLSVFKNNGNLNFAPELIIDANLNGIRSAIAADIDLDGDPDLVAGAYGELNWYKNDGSGNFSMAISISGNDYLDNISDIKTADIDLDGDLDILIAMEDRNELVWYTNIDNSDEFQSNIMYGIRNTQNEPRRIGIDDVNEDGRPDLIAASFDDNKVYWYENEDLPVFLSSPQDERLCQEGSVSFSINVDKSESYQWQRTNPWENWFYDIEDDMIFSGTNSMNLNLEMEDNALDQTKYRCKITYKGYEFISDEALLTVDRLIEANAGEDQDICLDFAWVGANFPSPGTGEWSVLQGTVEFEDHNSDYGQIYNIQVGLNVLEWTITNGTCVSVDAVEITRYDSVKLNMPFDSLEVMADQTVELYVQSSGDATLYQWYKEGIVLMDDDRISGALTPNLTITDVSPDDSGNYYCYVEGYCNSLYSDNIYLGVFFVNTNDLYAGKIKLFPNPVVDRMTIISNELIRSVSITDISGKKRLEEKRMNNETSLDVGDLPPGHYILKVITDIGLNSMLFIKE